MITGARGQWIFLASLAAVVILLILEVVSAYLRIAVPEDVHAALVACLAFVAGAAGVDPSGTPQASSTPGGMQAGGVH